MKAPSDRHDAADAVEARPCLDGSGTAHGPTDEDVGRRGERGEDAHGFDGYREVAVARRRPDELERRVGLREAVERGVGAPGPARAPGGGGGSRWTREARRRDERG